MAGELPRRRRAIMVAFVASGILVAATLIVFGAILALLADVHPSHFTASAIDLVRHTNNLGFRAMTSLTLAGMAAGAVIVIVGAVIALVQPR